MRCVICNLSKGRGGMREDQEKMGWMQTLVGSHGRRIPTALQEKTRVMGKGEDMVMNPSNHALENMRVERIPNAHKVASCEVLEKNARFGAAKIVVPGPCDAMPMWVADAGRN